MEKVDHGLRERYNNLSDLELIELRNSGNLTESAEAALIEELNKRKLTLDKINSIVDTEIREKKRYHLNSSPPPVPKVWIGFLIAGIALIAEFYDIYAGNVKVGIRTPILMIGSGYWLFCVDRFHRILDHISSGSYKLSAKTAAVFHLIPLYNIYWIIRWPVEFSNFLNENGKVTILPGWILGSLLLLFVLLGRAFDGTISLFCIFSLFLYMSSKLGKQVLSFETSKLQPVPQPYEESQHKWF